MRTLRFLIWTVLAAFATATHAQMRETVDTLEGRIAGCVPTHVHDIMVGAGTANILDTYLSPYNYTGVNMNLIRKTERFLWRRPSWLFQTLLNIDGSVLDNPGGNVNEYAGGVRYAVGWMRAISPYRHYRIFNGRASLNIFAGPMISGYLGCVYNERNGNNPAQAKADLMIDFSAKANVSFLFLHRYCNLDYQVILPCVGMAFSPNYGQSYYEAFEQENYDHNIVFAHPGNMPSLRQNLTFGIQIRKYRATQLLVGYSGHFMQSKFNNLRYHSYTNTLMVGLSHQFISK